MSSPGPVAPPSPLPGSRALALTRPATHGRRLERWERAEALGLEPPREVRAVLEREGDSKCLWDGMGHSGVNGDRTA